MAAAGKSGDDSPATGRIDTLGYPTDVDSQSATHETDDFEEVEMEEDEYSHFFHGVDEDASVAEAKEIAEAMDAEDYSKAEIETALRQSLNLQNAIITVVVGGATAYAGLNVMSSIGSSMNLAQGDMFYNASQSLENGIESFFTNLPTVFVVIALVLIIGYLTLLRGR